VDTQQTNVYAAAAYRVSLILHIHCEMLRCFTSYTLQCIGPIGLSYRYRATGHLSGGVYRKIGLTLSSMLAPDFSSNYNLLSNTAETQPWHCKHSFKQSKWTTVKNHRHKTQHDTSTNVSASLIN